MITINILWHQHQPDYRDPFTGTYLMPWVRLHAVRGYADLLNVLSECEEARCTVNFSGILLEQLYQHVESGIDDYFAQLSVKPASELSADERAFVLKHFFSCNASTMINPHSRYKELLAKKQGLVRSVGESEINEHFSDQDLADLLVWFNLAWIGFTGQKEKRTIELVTKGRNFTTEDQLNVIDLHRQIIRDILPGYGALAEDQKIELSFTPFHHPILPLVIDLKAEGSVVKDDPLPDFKFPNDARRHINKGMNWYEKCFERKPCGAWPAEGSISNSALGLLAEAGLSWAASDQANMPDSTDPLAHLRPYLWERDGNQLAMFFRDTRLADNIGFEYTSWQGKIAADHFLQMIKAMGDQSGEKNPVITVTLDGENPWEHYADGGETFLRSMFDAIHEDSNTRCATPSEIIASSDLHTIGEVKSGSWINGNFDIWSHHSETRSAWRLLARARKALGNNMPEDSYESILAAEGSDWFWWYGDDFATDQAAEFDSLFRRHLCKAYEAAGEKVPDELYATVRKEQQQWKIEQVPGLMNPKIDGRITSYYEWHNGIKASDAVALGSMARSSRQGISELVYGFGEELFYLRISVSDEWLKKIRDETSTIELSLSQGDNEKSMKFSLQSALKLNRDNDIIAIDELLELAINISEHGIIRGELAYFSIKLKAATGEVLRYPDTGKIPVVIISDTFAYENWSV